MIHVIKSACISSSALWSPLIHVTPVWERAVNSVYCGVSRERLSVCVCASFPFGFRVGVRFDCFTS